MTLFEQGGLSRWPAVVLSILTHSGILSLLPCQGLGNFGVYPGLRNPHYWSHSMDVFGHGRRRQRSWVPPFPSHTQTQVPATRPQSENNTTGLQTATPGGLDRKEGPVTFPSLHHYIHLFLLKIPVIVWPMVERLSILHPDSLPCPKQCPGLHGCCEACVIPARSHSDSQLNLRGSSY